MERRRSLTINFALDRCHGVSDDGMTRFMRFEALWWWIVNRLTNSGAKYGKGSARLESLVSSREFLKGYTAIDINVDQSTLELTINEIIVRPQLVEAIIPICAQCRVYLVR